MITSPACRRLAVATALGLALAASAPACGGDDGESAETTATTMPIEQATTDADQPGPDQPGAPTTVATTKTTDGPTPSDVPTPTTTEAASKATTTDAATSTGATSTTEQQVSTTVVNVYWGWTVQNPTAGTPERIGAGGREVEADTPVRNSLDALFDGVDAAERDIGMVSSIPEGTQVLGIAVDGTTATVDLSAEFERPGGTLEETMRLAQVVFTVTQFDGLDRVEFHIAGEPRDAVLSHGFEVGDGLTRDDFHDVRARIMVEEPYPGATVGNPLVIRGESNTFEATVRFAVTVGGGDGIVLTEGFTTATGGMGTWGTFEIGVDLTEFADDYVAGPGSVILWEDSPRTGDPVDVVEIPVVFPSL